MSKIVTQSNKATFRTNEKRYFSSIVLVVFSSLLLTACEAALDLEGIENTLNEPVRRTDQILTVEKDEQGKITAFGESGLVLNGTYTDGSIDWSRNQLKTSFFPNFTRSDTCPDGTQVALSFENQLWYSKANESTWNHASIGTEEQVEDIACIAESTVWISGAYSTLITSNDLGQTWDDKSTGEDASLTAIQFVDDLHGYAVGEFGTVLYTEDAGETWQNREPMDYDFYPLSLYFVSSKEGWVSGVLGIIWHTTDGAQTWKKESVDSHASIYGFFQAHGELFAYGDQGALLRYDDGNWVDQPSPEIPIHYSAGVEITNDKVLLVGGWGINMIVPVGDNSDMGIAESKELNDE